MKKILIEQINALRDAIAKDEQEQIRAYDHANNLRALQNREIKINGEIANLKKKLKKLKQIKLKKVQADIVDAIKVEFDLSDDMTIAAAKDTLAKLENDMREASLENEVQDMTKPVD